MSALGTMLERIRGLDLERSLGLRAESPKLAIGLDQRGVVLARLGRGGRGGRVPVEAVQLADLEQSPVPATLFEAANPAEGFLAEPINRLLEQSGSKPGKVSVVLPDNLAKTSLLTLPEWPPSRRQLEEIVRFRMRKSAPFRLDDATMSYQVFPGKGSEIAVLVALMRRDVVERFERELEAVGCRPGLVDLATTNLANLCRERIDAAAEEGGDVALLNSADSYFTLTIIRDGSPIFFRCKSLTIGATAEADGQAMSELLAREVDSSFAYYREKLDGRGIGTMMVRSVNEPPARFAERLAGLGVKRVEPVEPAARVVFDGVGEVEFETRQRLAPTIGAALGRG